MVATLASHGGVVPAAPYRNQIIPSWAHPEVIYWAPTWQKIRDCVLGEQEIKDKGTDYLPKMPDMDEGEYDAFKENAIFFNMTARTVTALVGTVFQRSPKISDLPKRLEEKFPRCCYESISFPALLTAATEGVIQMGRYGGLVDYSTEGKRATIRGYDAENIIDWQEDEVNGLLQPVQIVVREFKEVIDRKIGTPRSWKVVYRVLSLDETPAGYVYRQYIYTVDSIHADLSSVEPVVVEPTRRGKTLDFIPFKFASPKLNTPQIDRPPCADIASLNIGHYRAYAHLEHGRFYTAMPIYYVQVAPGNEKAEYILGASRVWECAIGEKPGILEFNGSGLKTLENSCAQKEEQIAAIGGRLMGGGARAVSESDNQAELKESNERTLLLKVIENVNDWGTQLLRWWCWWEDTDNPTVEVELNTTFLFDNLGARELRAAHAMYKEGIVPITVLHSYLQKAEVVPEWMLVDEFKTLLDDMDEFPNQPDVWAKKLGYADAKHRHDVRLARRELRNTEELTEVEWEKVGVTKTDVEGTLDTEDQKLKIAQQDADTRQKVASRPLPKQVGAARQAAKSPAK